jgi:hypothetical protein
VVPESPSDRGDKIVKPNLIRALFLLAIWDRTKDGLHPWASRTACFPSKKKDGA